VVQEALRQETGNVEDMLNEGERGEQRRNKVVERKLRELVVGLPIRPYL